MGNSRGVGRRTNVRTLAVGCVALFAGIVAGTASAAPPSPVPLAPPAVTAIPAGPLGDAIRLGLRMMTDTQSAAAPYVGNGLLCVSCHLDQGRAAYASPLVGLTGVFPEYRARRGRVESLEERIDDCFLRSMNGKALPPTSPEMIGLLAYTAWLSQGIPIGVEVVGRGFRDLAAPATPDAAHGKTLFAAKCAACHGADGQGTPGGPAGYYFPPLWGARSFNDGAGMARVSVAAAFLQAKMPLGSGGTLSAQEAYDIAAYFTAQPRPSFAERAADWPNGSKPADAR